MEPVVLPWLGDLSQQSQGRWSTSYLTFESVSFYGKFHCLWSQIFDVHCKYLILKIAFSIAFRDCLSGNIFVPFVTCAQNGGGEEKTASGTGEAQAPPLTNWFAEVLELRRRANEYKRRAQVRNLFEACYVRHPAHLKNKKKKKHWHL